MKLQLLTAITTVILVMAAVPVQAQKTQLKFASFPPPKSTLNRLVLTPWIAEVNKALGGSVSIKLYAGGSLGRSPAKQLKLVRDGVADFALITMPYSPSIFPDSSVFELPFLIRSASEGSAAHWRLHKTVGLQGYDRLHWIGLTTLTPYLIHTTKPLSSIDDLKGRKIRGAGRIHIKVLEALGTTPVSGPIPRAAEALSRGTYNGILADWNAIVNFRLSKVAKYHYQFPFTTVALGLGMNREVYANLPKKVRATLDSMSGKSLSERMGVAWESILKRPLDKIRADASHKIVNPSSAERARVKSLLRPITDTWIRENPRGQTIYDALQKILADIRKQS